MFDEIVAKYLKILNYFDDGDFLDIPTDEEKQTSFSEIETFQHAFVQEYELKNIRFEKGEDAFFKGRIFQPRPCRDHQGDVMFLYYFSIIFSNYGNLVTIKGEITHDMLTSLDIASLLEKHGFVYIPYEIACLPYDGNCLESFRELVPQLHYTWFDRYFAYRWN